MTKLTSLLLIFSITLSGLISGGCGKENSNIKNYYSDNPPAWFKGNQYQIDKAKERNLPVAKEITLPNNKKLKMVYIPFDNNKQSFYVDIYETTNDTYSLLNENHDCGTFRESYTNN